MTTDIARRHALYEHARDTWGADTAETLMDLLPTDPNELVTKSDLAVFGADLRAELVGKMADQTRMLVLAMVTMTVTIVLAVVFA
ncbi:hypothetical protein [Aquihabitans sp. McL0605]|uniref:hypothetical protein n=1 Tax=Aquihabitans sp. McL0605 TaxID=3415671 RepID=UPI003CF4754F